MKRLLTVTTILITSSICFADWTITLTVKSNDLVKAGIEETNQNRNALKKVLKEDCDFYLRKVKREKEDATEQAWINTMLINKPARQPDIDGVE